MAISLVEVALSSNWRKTDTSREIEDALQGTSWTLEKLLEWCREIFQDKADEASNYETIRVNEDFEDNELYVNFRGVGEATRTPGMKGDYYTPDDPDICEYSISHATVEIWPHDEDGEKLGEWDITNLI